jgi:trans-feruloyl-CoA hydratase/vanillin synthase
MREWIMAKDIKDLVNLEYDDRVAWVTINRPEKRNGLSPNTSLQMLGICDEVEAREDVGVLVLTGEGTAFSAGMDLKEYFRDLKAQPRILPIHRQART